MSRSSYHYQLFNHRIEWILFFLFLWSVITFNNTQATFGFGLWYSCNKWQLFSNINFSYVCAVRNARSAITSAFQWILYRFEHVMYRWRGRTFINNEFKKRRTLLHWINQTKNRSRLVNVVRSWLMAIVSVRGCSTAVVVPLFARPRILSVIWTISSSTTPLISNKVDSKVKSPLCSILLTVTRQYPWESRRFLVIFEFPPNIQKCSNTCLSQISCEVGHICLPLVTLENLPYVNTYVSTWFPFACSLFTFKKKLTSNRLLSLLTVDILCP